MQLWRTWVTAFIPCLLGTHGCLLFKAQFVGIFYDIPKKEGKPPNLTNTPEEQHGHKGAPDPTSAPLTQTSRGGYKLGT